MKTNYFLSILTVVSLIGFSSCKTKTEGDPVVVVTASPIKSIAFTAGTDTEEWDFTYDATSKKLTQFVDYWDAALDKTITYDYSVAGKLTLNNGTSVYNVYDINTQGNITKDGDGNTFVYDANGFLVQYFEYWSNASHLKYQMTITNGNITRITTFNDDGVTPKKIKEFSYTSGDNVNNIQQANVLDSEWKQLGVFYGKPSAKLVSYFEYWDPQVSPIVKSKSTLTYVFDAKNRPTTVTKTLVDLTTEKWVYTYYE